MFFIKQKFLEDVGPSAYECSGSLRQLADSPEDVIPSWLRKWRNIHRLVLQYEDSEGVDHALGSVVVLSSKDDIETTLSAMLSSVEKQPRTMKSQAANPQTINFFVILHDCEGDSAKAAEESSKSAAQYLSSKYGPEALQVLPINTNQNSAGKTPWDEFYERNDIEIKAMGGLQAGLVSTMLENYVTKIFLPQVEKRIRYLHQQVATTRKGLMNQMRIKLWRRDKDKDRQARQAEMGSASTPASSAGAKHSIPIAEYTYDTPEGQLRNLGDLTYLLKDFDASASSYRILLADLKSDKSREHLASAYESLGNSLIGNAEDFVENRWRLSKLTSAYKKEVESTFMEAIECYKKSGKIWQASRSACTLAHWYCRRDHHKEAVRSFRIAADKTPHVIAGPALELASHASMRIRPTPSVRRASFDMILAGFRYSQASLRMHAMRTYMSVASEYDKREWVHINDHLCSSIGRQSAHLRQYPNALPWFVKLLESTRQPSNMQKGYLQEFALVYKQASKSNDAPLLLTVKIPDVDAFSIQAVFEDWRTASSSGVAVCPGERPESLIHSDLKVLESGLIPSETLQNINQGSLNWLDAASGSSNDRTEIPTMGKVVAGEWIQIRFTMLNPLTVDLKLSTLQLNCTLLSSSGTEIPESADIEVSEMTNMNLEAKEKRSICLSVRCTQPGKLVMTAISWTLDQNVLVEYPLTDLGSLKLKSKEKRLRTNLPIKQRLVFEVVDSMPKLVLEEDDSNIHRQQEPLRVKQGELRRLDTKVCNIGKVPLKNLRMKLPKTILLDSSSDNSLWEEIAPSKYQDLSTGTNGPSQLYQYKQDKVQSGESLKLSLVLCCFDKHITPTDKVVLLYFEPMANSEHGMPFRIFGLGWDVEIIGGPMLTCYQYPNWTDLQQSILKIEFRNSRADGGEKGFEKPYELRLLRMISSGLRWSLVVPFQEDGKDNTETPGSNSGGSTYFRVIDQEPSEEQGNTLPWLLLKKKVMSRSAADSNPMLGLCWKHTDQNTEGVCIVSAQNVTQNHPIRLRITVDKHHSLVNNVCTVPVQFFVFNTTSTRAKICLSLRKKEKSLSKESHGTSGWFRQKKNSEEMVRLERVPRREYFWSGVTQHRCDNLAPFREISLGCRMVTTRPGSIELGDFLVYYELFSSDDETTPFLQGSFTGHDSSNFQAPVIVVHDANDNFITNYGAVSSQSTESLKAGSLHQLGKGLNQSA